LVSSNKQKKTCFVKSFQIPLKKENQTQKLTKTAKNFSNAKWKKTAGKPRIDGPMKQ
jgi:hypothetical protein